MDIATLVGFLLAYVIIGTAISLGGPFILFVNAPSLLIVIGGTFAVTLMRITLTNFFGSFKIALKGFFYRLDAPQSLIEESVELANVARKEGILALEGREISNTFLERGIGLCIDGHAPEVVKNLLAKDINMSIERHTIGADMFKAMAVYAPAMGMIGTLIGLVQMLANMSDPAAIGPAMAVALLTTLYGAVIANAFASPLAEKLILIRGYEKLNKDLILESITGIQEGTNPRVLKQLLNAYLPESKRQEEE
ncbi:MAG: flagellar motor protein PomA [Gammaproteobacteria bacterium]|nr:flagellar motor protein PomA [Gammaproteobacteria bacterium]